MSPPARLTLLLPLLAGLAVVLWVLRPVYMHAYVSVPPPAERIVQYLRQMPDDATLAELVGQRPLGPPLPQGAEAAVLANSWLSQFRLHGPSASHPIAHTVTADTLMQDMGVGGLPFSSLVAPDVLVQAYRSSGDAQYLSQARDLILAYARYERATWRERGFLWNDHAIAARVGVIIRFWSSYRSHAMFSIPDAAEILQHVARSSALLAAPEHFTAWSNHGVMQNVALLQLAAVFPGLVDEKAISELALDRLAQQWRYYLSSEGVVLEHSAGYHRDGSSLLKMALRLLEINRLGVPTGWREQVQRADEFLGRLTRPDGSLPAFGDTPVKLLTVPQRAPMSTTDPQAQQLALYPLSGYAVWSAAATGGFAGSHSVATWSHFPGQAHKHADETGLVVWSDGRGWITPTGYAPYGTAYRAPTEGWLGSNAPHGVDELPDPTRRSRLLGTASSPLAVLVDTQRSSPSGVGYRRQIASLGGLLWLVIDQPIGHAPLPRTETIWTFFPDLLLEPLGERTFALRDSQGHTFSVALAHGGGSEASVSQHAGSRQPFAGWLATDQGMLQAPALRVVADGRGWTATLFGVDKTATTVDVRLTDAENWQAAGQGWLLRREGGRLVSRLGGQEQTQSVVAPPETGLAAAAIESSLKATLGRFPKYKNLDDYRLRAAAWLAGLWMVQAIAYLALEKSLRRRGWSTAAQAMILVFWGGLGVWLGTSYFAG